MTDEKLMRLFMRTNALARRKQRSGDEDPKCLPNGRGAGHILDMLMTREGLSQQEIADEIGIRPQSVSDALVRLEAKGLIQRVASETDKRMMRIYITEEGKHHRAQLTQARIAHAQSFFSPLSEQEKQELYAILHKLKQAHKDSVPPKRDRINKEEIPCQEE